MRNGTGSVCVRKTLCITARRRRTRTGPVRTRAASGPSAAGSLPARLPPVGIGVGSKTAPRESAGWPRADPVPEPGSGVDGEAWLATLADSTLAARAHSILHTPYSTLHTPYSTLHTPHSTLHHLILPRRVTPLWKKKSVTPLQDLPKKGVKRGDNTPNQPVASFAGTRTAPPPHRPTADTHKRHNRATRLGFKVTPSPHRPIAHTITIKRESVCRLHRQLQSLRVLSHPQTETVPSTIPHPHRRLRPRQPAPTNVSIIRLQTFAPASLLACKPLHCRFRSRCGSVALTTRRRPPPGATLQSYNQRNQRNQRYQPSDRPKTHAVTKPLEAV